LPSKPIWMSTGAPIPVAKLVDGGGDPEADGST
jgi:hypothetical protein